MFTPGTEDPLRIAPRDDREIHLGIRHAQHLRRQSATGANWQGHDPIENTGFTYEYTFKVKGTDHYWCEPHKSLGMVADIIVE